MCNVTPPTSTYLQLWEVIENLGEFVVEVLLSELDLAHVEVTDTRYLVVLVYHSRCLALGPRQHNVNEILRKTREKLTDR